jgi:hypothetical protein
MRDHLLPTVRSRSRPAGRAITPNSTMHYSKTLLRAEMWALAALAAVSLTLGVGYALADSIGTGIVTFQVAFVIGLAPVAMYGAPLYTWLHRQRLLTWPRVVAVGAVPGILSSPFSWTFGLVALAVGVAVACVLHCLFSK